MRLQRGIERRHRQVLHTLEESHKHGPILQPNKITEVPKGVHIFCESLLCDFYPHWPRRLQIDSMEKSLS
jgi:hypothetical protein